MRIWLGTVTLLRYVSCLTNLGQKGKVAARYRDRFDSDYAILPMYELSSSVDVNASEIVGQWVKSSGLSHEVTGKRIAPVKSTHWRSSKRFPEKLETGTRRRVAKTSRGGFHEKRRAKESAARKFKFIINGSVDDALGSRWTVTPIGVKSNLSDYEEKMSNLSVVLGSDAVVTDYDYGFILKGFRSNAGDDGRNPSAANGSGAYAIVDDVTGHVVDYRWGFLSLFLLVLMGGLGNILVCLSICLERRLQNVTNYFLLSLAVADLLVCVAVMPFSIGDAFYGHWPFGWHLCSFWVSCDVLSCSSSILHMCVVSVGRYMGIRNPLKTRSRASGKRTALVKIALVWLASCAIASPIAVLALLDPTNIQPRDDLCAINNRFFFVFGSLFAFYAPMLVMVTSYALTVHLLRKKAQFCQMENVCSATTMVAGGPRKVSLTPFEVDTCLRCGEKADVRLGERDRSKTTSTWKVFLTKKRKRNETNSNVSREDACRPAESIFEVADEEGSKDDARTDFVAMEMGETSVCRYCGSTRMSRTSSTNSKERQRFPSTLLRSRKRSSERSSSASFEAAIASTSGTNSILRKISTSSKHENGKNACGKESARTKGGPTMFRVLGSTTRAQVHNEQKATKVLGLVFFAFVVCWSPFFVLNILFAVMGPDSLPEYLATTFLWLGYISSTINPLIYTAFNRTFRRAFWKLLTCGKCGSGGSGFASAYVGSRMERGFRGTSSSSVNAKRRIEWGDDRLKKSVDQSERAQFRSDKAEFNRGKPPKETEITENSRYVYRGSGSEKNKRKKKPIREEKRKWAGGMSSPELVTKRECGICDFQSDEGEAISQCRSEPNSSIRRQFLVKSLSTSCAEEIELATEEDRLRQGSSRATWNEVPKVAGISGLEEFGSSVKGRKPPSGRKRQQLRLTSQKEKKSDRNQTFC